MQPRTEEDPPSEVTPGSKLNGQEDAEVDLQASPSGNVHVKIDAAGGLYLSYTQACC